jgi:transcriptional regulator with XRE-family HTH domain
MLSMVTGSQMRAARAILRWSGETLAEKAGVGIQTIKRMEAVDGVPPGRAATVSDVQRALEAAGIEFIDENGGGPGVRLRERQRPKKSK